ncbi:MAG: DNA polymerase III subunit delta [Candidatus Saccharimonadales bacterium]
MIVTITGVNDFARKGELNQLVAVFLREHDAMAVERLDGEEASAEQMQAAVQSLPFLTARKLVILRELGKQKSFAEKIEDVLKDVADTTDLIIVEPKLDKRLSYYKTLKKQTDFREFGELDAPALAAWAIKYAKEQGSSLGSVHAKLLIDRLGASQQLLQSELDKLLAYDSDITKATIELLVEPLPQSTVFELLDAAFQGKTERAFALYHEQRALKVEPQAIIAMLAWQLHVLAVVKAAGQRDADDIAKTAKLNPFVVRKSLGLARNRTLAQIRQMVADLLGLDLRLKTATTDADEALQLYLLKLAV